MGFEVSFPVEGETQVLTKPMTVQYSWGGAPVAERILCGLGTTVSSDLERVIKLSNEIPIRVQIGYTVERRSEGAAASISFLAQGWRSPAKLQLTTPTMACSLSPRFVMELFDAVEGQMAQSAVGLPSSLAVHP
jgi:hypothetical protein